MKIPDPAGIFGSEAKRELRSRLAPWLAAGLLFAGALVALPHGDLFHAENFLPLVAGAALMTLGYLLALIAGNGGPLVFWTAAIGVRLLFLFMEPGDDIWRYIWEGRIQLAGHSPFLEAPDSPRLAHLRPDWWWRINHPGATTIYPPLIQLLFRALASIGEVVVFKAVFASVDLLLCRVLWNGFGKQNAWLYGWNPLVLYTTAGGGHFEPLLLLPLALFVLSSDSRQTGARSTLVAALFAGLAVGAKYLALPVVLWWCLETLRSGPRKWAFLAAAAAGAPLLAASAVFFLEQGRLGDLYPKDFVTHARGGEWLPWLVSSALGGWSTNGIFAVFMLLTSGWAMVLSRTGQDFVRRWLWIFLLFNPSNHFWYFPYVLPWGGALWSVRAALWLNCAGWLYLMMPWRAMVEGVWAWKPWERLAVWLPGSLMLAWSARRKRSTRKPPTSC